MADGILIRFGYVTNVIDPKGGTRIQARTTYDTIKSSNEELQWYIPLLPKTLHIVPKVGELVLLFSMAPGDFNHAGYYIGPLISQEDKLFKEEWDKAMSVTSIGDEGWDPNPRLKDGVPLTIYPETEDITLEGRKDTGIQLKEEEVRIKAGVKVIKDGKLEMNTQPAYVSLKYYPDNTERDGFKSTATIVADKINLIGTSSDDLKTKEIPITGDTDTKKDNLISDSAMKELINKAHQLPYGDTLIDFLSLLRNAFLDHVHPFPTMSPCKDENVMAVSNYNLPDILSDTVRIN